MPGEPSDLDPQRLWQTQTKEHEPMTVAEIHDRARVFRSKVRRRNFVEYLCCVVVIAGFTPTLLQHQSWMLQLGALLIMGATVPVGWQLHRRAAAPAEPHGGESLIASYRQELIRQRDAARSIGVWYLAPFAPGVALLIIGRWFQAHAPHRTIGLDHLIILLTAAIMALVFAVIWLVNQRAADRLQKRIDEL